MGKATADLLVACLDDIRAGRRTIDECLLAHPSQAETLRPLIETALSIIPPAPVELDPAFRQRGRRALVEAIAASQQATARSALALFWRTMAGSERRTGRPAASGMRLAATSVLLLLIVTAALGGGAAYASQNSLPGDLLYRVKITVETLQVSLATDDEAKTRAYAWCAAARVEEAQAAVDMERAYAAGAAAEGYSGCVAKAEAHLTMAATSGRDVTELADGLSQDLGRQWATLEVVAGRTKGETWVALDRAAHDAGRVRETATAVAQGHGPKSMLPGPTPSAGTNQAVPPEQPAAQPSGGRDGAKDGPGLAQPEAPATPPARPEGQDGEGRGKPEPEDRQRDGDQGKTSPNARPAGEDRQGVGPTTQPEKRGGPGQDGAQQPPPPAATPQPLETSEPSRSGPDGSGRGDTPQPQPASVATPVPAPPVLAPERGEPGPQGRGGLEEGSGGKQGPSTPSAPQVQPAPAPPQSGDGEGSRSGGTESGRGHDTDGR